MNAFNSLSPVFALIILGVVLKRTGFVDEAFVKGGNRLVYWVGLPALLFKSVATAKISLGDHVDAIAVFYIATLLVIAIAVGISTAMGFSREVRGPFIQGSFRGNIAYVGLPVIVLGVVDPTGEIGVLAVLMLAVAVPLINACAVVALEMAKHKLSWSVAPVCIKSIVTNPLIIACASGGVFNFLSKSAGHEILPVALVSFFDLLGQMALPFALLSIGAALRFGEVRGEVRPVLISSLMKTIIAPLVGALVVLLFPVDEVERRILLVFLACPAAAVTFVMVDQIGGSKPVAAGIVLASTVLSFPALFGVLWLLNHS